MHAGGLVAAVGTAEQKADLLGRLSAGEIVLAAADTSPGGRWASRADGVRASVSDGSWTLDGVADPVMGGASADHLVVTAALPDGGTGVFVVDASAASVTGYAAADLTRAASVRFEASAATPLGEPGRDLSPSIATISDLTRIMGANQALGVMQSQVRATTDYLKSRKQFGVTLNTFQALTFRAADMYVSARARAQHGRLGDDDDRRRRPRRRWPTPPTAWGSRCPGRRATSGRRPSSSTAASA